MSARADPARAACIVGIGETRFTRRGAQADIGEWAQMNEVWDAWVAPGCTPARATVEAKLAAPGFKVEIMITAAR